MKTSIATASIPGELSDKLKAIAGAGFDGIEIFEQEFIAYSETPAEVGKMIRDHGLRIDLFQPLRDPIGLPQPLQATMFDRIERRFDVMSELGADLLLVSSSTHPGSIGGIDRTAEIFSELGDLAAARDMRVGYEAVTWGPNVSDYRDAWEVVRRANHQAIGLILDSFHILTKSSDINAINTIPGDRIFHVQLSDAPNIDMDPEYMSRHFRCMPGEGDLPLLEFMQAVVETGYSGPFSTETLSARNHSDSARIAALDAQRSLLYLGDQTRHVTDLSQANLPDLSPKGVVRGIEFIEFTANTAEAETLGKTLYTLGFAPSAQHISKAVTLWQQEEINIVINTEQECFAHSAYVMHGTSVCDIGLMLQDASNTVERASQLGANLFAQSIGAGELDIPAVRGVGGSVLHFLDQKSGLANVWDTEFKPLGEDPNTHPVGLSRVDHIAQVMEHDELLSWTSFYTSIFEMEKAPEVDIADPGGIVHSRALQSKDGAIRLTLNGVESHRTFAGRFVSDSFGGSVQHLAFATEDIFATANSLAANEFNSLPIPENYYREIKSRFGLDSEFVHSLKNANILYDEDANGGSFFQLYSQPYGDGFFFEIVDRKNGYDGYGAPNAAYRTAALKRLSRPAGMPRR